MGFSPAPKLETPKAYNTTGISMSMSVSPKGKRASVRITITEGAQIRMFGRKLVPEKDRMDVLIGRGQDEGRARLRLDPEGEFTLSGGVRGSVSLRMGRWDLLPNCKYPAGTCTDLGDPEKEGDAICILLNLPDWASPKKRERAAMSAKRPTGTGQGA